MNIGMIGCTDFVGSALATHFLLDGKKVIAFEPNDPKGHKVRAAIQRVMLGFEYTEVEIDWSNLEVVSIDHRDLSPLRDLECLRSIDYFWYAKETLNVSASKIEESYLYNFSLAAEFYDIVSEVGDECSRFYYLSSIYSQGQQAFVPESISHKPKFSNAFQASKWSAESSLSIQSIQKGLPISLIRAPLIVGHSETGWYGNQHIGIYQLIGTMVYCAQSGINLINLDLDRKKRISILPINYFVEQVHSIVSSDKMFSKMEVVNCHMEQTYELGLFIDIAAQLLDVRLEISAPRTNLERRVNKMLNKKLIEAYSAVDLESKALRRVLSTSLSEYKLDHDQLETLVRNYVFEEMSRTFHRDKSLKGLILDKIINPIRDLVV